MNAVLLLGPWNFRGSLVVLKIWGADCVFDDLDFDLVDFWLHASNLPQCNLTVDCAAFIGNFVGKFVSADLGALLRKRQSHSLRIRVQLSLSHPLVTGFFLERAGKPRVWIPFRYERLADFCYRCGVLTHVETRCTTQVSSPFGPLDPGVAFGPWLRFGFSPISFTPPSRPVPQQSLTFDKENIPPNFSHSDSCIYPPALRSIFSHLSFRSPVSGGPSSLLSIHLHRPHLLLHLNLCRTD